MTAQPPGPGGRDEAHGRPAEAAPPGRDDEGADVGLLAPVWAGSAVERLTSDAAWLRAMLAAEAALTRAWAAVGLAPAAAAAAVDTACAELSRLDARDLALRARAGGNPVIPLVRDLRAAVAARDLAAAGYVHLAATSQDILDTATMLVARAALGALAADLARAEAALAALARRHRDTPLPARTLTQHAVPTTFGLKAAGWRALVLDAAARVDALLATGLPAQLGGAAGTLAAAVATARAAGPPGTPTLTEPPQNLAVRLMAAFAAELGLAEPVLPWHVLRTPVADLGAALAFTTGALGKIAADVLLGARTESGELAEPSGGGSSAMPHKSNPVRATLVVGAARACAPLAATLFGALVAEDERPAGAWHAEWQPLREALRLAGGAAAVLADLVSGLRVDEAAMRAHLGLTGGLIVSERLVAELGQRIGAAAARELTERAARAAGHGRPFADAVLDQFGELAGERPELAGALTAGELAALLDPAGYTGAAGALVDRALVGDRGVTAAATRPATPPAGGAAGARAGPGG